MLPPDYRVASAADQKGPWRNRLALESSLYLRQHADNPIDWRPWGEEAFDAAARRDVPIFLSIGYAACHWCHVMERESFADPGIAALLNEHFVAIKVDREQHPAVDAFYVEALLRLNGEAGWPASLFLAPDRRPFQGGTYYPPFYRYGLPGFADVLRGARDGWRHNREALLQAAEKLCAAIAAPEGAAGRDRPPQGGAPPGIGEGVRALIEGYDARYGGWGDGAKFPQAPRLELLLARVGEPEARGALLHQLGAMARGGIHDHLAGGFHRYAVDPEWEVPHFEKMLYDSALLARVYLRAWAAGGEAGLLRVGCQALEWMLAELGRPDGLLAASFDADDPGGEGHYYTWTPEELDAALGPAAGRAFGAAYGVTFGGNVEGRSTLRRAGDEGLLSAVRGRLLAARRRRAPPARDDKAVCAWNAMAASALALGGRLIGEARYVAAAERIGGFLAAAGDLRRVIGGQAPGVIEDYAWAILALLDLHEATGEPRWLLRAAERGEELVARFWDGEALGVAAAGEGSLPARQAAWIDHAEPAGSALALLALEELAGLGGPDPAALWAAAPAGAPPEAHSTLLLARALRERPLQVVVLAGDPADAGFAALRAVCRRTWRPSTRLVEVHPGSPLPARLAALRGKPTDGPARAWICEGTACRLPIREPAGLEAALRG